MSTALPIVAACPTPRRAPILRLRLKTLLIIGIATLVIVLALYAAARHIIVDGFAQVERAETVRNVRVAEDALAATIAAISTKATDWAAWDDTYAFMADRNPAYIASNLTSESISNLDLHGILFFNVEGQLVCSSTIDPATLGACPAPPGIVAAIRDSGLLEHPGRASAPSGILRADGVHCLVASRPIVTSRNEGPIRGSVVFVRVLTDSLVARLARRSHLLILARPIDDPSLPADCVAATHQLTTDPTTVIARGPDTISGYAVIRDVSGAPTLVLRTTTPRPIYAQGLLSLRWLIISIVVAAIIIGAVVLILLNRLVVARLERMSDQVRSIAADGDAGSLSERGSDEISCLATDINGMVRVITHSRNALDIARRTAEAANSAKSEFLASMSHEIRTPMTAVLGYAELLMDSDIPDSERQECLRTIHAGGQSLLAIINDILDISKIEAGLMAVERVDACPFMIVAQVLQMLRPRAQQKGLALESRCDSPIPATIRSDPARLRQILLNLVGNALKFTEHGSVTVAMRLEQPSAHSAAPRLVIDVTDTGIGLTAEQMGRLFSPFSQAEPSITRRFGGTGLGLSISRKLAEALGGTVTVSSTHGSGSTFTLSIDPGPLEGVRLLAAPPAQRNLSMPGSPVGSLPTLNGRILLADDSPEGRRLIARMLTKAGARVDLAEDGAAAIDKALEARRAGSPFSLILMDMQMPDVDGYAATRRLREQGDTTPIVALTAYTTTGEREKCIDAGCSDYLAKPVSRAELITRCRIWLDRATVARDAA